MRFPTRVVVAAQMAITHPVMLAWLHRTTLAMLFTLAVEIVLAVTIRQARVVRPTKCFSKI